MCYGNLKKKYTKRMIDFNLPTDLENKVKQYQTNLGFFFEHFTDCEHYNSKKKTVTLKISLEGLQTATQ